MYLLVAGSLSVFAACGGACSADCAKECCAVEEVVACADDCQKACCLGCKATEGEASCSLLAAGDHSCCAAHSDDEVDVEYDTAEDAEENSHEGHNHE